MGNNDENNNNTIHMIIQRTRLFRFSLLAHSNFSVYRVPRTSKSERALHSILFLLPLKAKDSRTQDANFVAPFSYVQEGDGRGRR